MRELGLISRCETGDSIGGGVPVLGAFPSLGALQETKKNPNNRSNVLSNLNTFILILSELISKT
jgi:hypothetical protein